MRKLFKIIALAIMANFICIQLSAQANHGGQNAKKVLISSSIDKKTPTDSALSKVNAIPPSNCAKTIIHTPENNNTSKTNANISGNKQHAEKRIMAVDTVNNPLKKEEDPKNKPK